MKLKALEDNESTYRNGGGNLCGGVISQSRFDESPMGNVMPDDKFELYKNEKDEKKAHILFKKYARSMI